MKTVCKKVSLGKFTIYYKIKKSIKILECNSVCGNGADMQEYRFREAPKNLFGTRFIFCAEISEDNGRESKETRRRDANRQVRASVALASYQISILPKTHGKVAC